MASNTSSSKEGKQEHHDALKPVLKHSTNATTTTEQAHHHPPDHHLKWDPQATAKASHECEPEFMEHRKQHYNEVQEVRKFRQDHPEEELLAVNDDDNQVADGTNGKTTSTF